MSDPALIVSICSAMFTGGGLITQLLLYRFNGARLKVQLVFCYRTDFSMLLSCTGSRKRISFERWRNEHRIDLGIEYAKVRVTNIGRTPVSVEDISFDLGRVRWFRRWRHIVIPMQFIDPNEKQPKEVDLSPHRLDPGDNITVSFHLWPTLGNPDQFKHPKFRRLVVRGSARAVGRNATRSRRRDAWRFRKGELSAFHDVAIPSPEVRVYRSLWHHSYGVERRPVWRHREVVKRLQDGQSPEGIRVYLDGLNIDPATGEPEPYQTHGIVAHEAHHAFHKTSVLSLWPEVAPPRKVSRRDRVYRVLFGQRTRG